MANVWKFDSMSESYKRTSHILTESNVQTCTIFFIFFIYSFLNLLKRRTLVQMPHLGDSNLVWLWFNLWYVLFRGTPIPCCLQHVHWSRSWKRSSLHLIKECGNVLILCVLHSYFGVVHLYCGVVPLYCGVVYLYFQGCCLNWEVGLLFIMWGFALWGYMAKE